MKITEPADQLLTVKELAELLQVPVPTIHNWRYRRQGPKGFRVGRHIRFLKSDVDSWLAHQRKADRSSEVDQP
jgi:excisionase family DNA binding protein